MKNRNHTSFLCLFGTALRLGCVFLFSLAVPAWTRADADFEAPPAQNDPAGAEKNQHVKQRTFLKRDTKRFVSLPHIRTSADLLRGLQGQDGEDGPAVHAPHAGAIAHEAQKYGGRF